MKDTHRCRTLSTASVSISISSCLMTFQYWLKRSHTLQLNIPVLWHYNDVIMSVSNHQPHDCVLNCLFKAQIKENINAPRHWPLWGEFTGDRWIARTKVQWRGKYVSIWWRHQEIFVCSETPRTSHSNSIIKYGGFPSLRERVEMYIVIKTKWRIGKTRFFSTDCLLDNTHRASLSICKITPVYITLFRLCPLLSYYIREGCAHL